jgi:hypothetical protein
VKGANGTTPFHELQTWTCGTATEGLAELASDCRKTPESLYEALTLLHKGLSEGLHTGNDAECLEIAQNIRVILTEFSERLHTALKDDQELKTAVSRILNRSQTT